MYKRCTACGMHVALGTYGLPVILVRQLSLLMLRGVLQGGWEGKLSPILFNNVHHLLNCFSLKGAKGAGLSGSGMCLQHDGLLGMVQVSAATKQQHCTP